MTRRTRRTLLVAALAVAALAGCGVPIDGSPRPITRTTVANVPETPTTIASSGAPEVSVYFLRGDQLERQGYPVEGEATLGQAIDYVLAGPADGSVDLHSSIPPKTEVRSIDLEDGIATIDLTGAINDVAGPTQKEAFAQLAFTALDFAGVRAIQFLVDGEAIDAPTDDGNLALVTADNFDEPLNPR